MRYSQTHCWASLQGDIATIGITHFAQKELGEVVHIELGAVGDEILLDDLSCVLESTKAATDIYSPLTGKIIEINEALLASPSKVNTSAEKEGWLFKLQIKDKREYEQLMSSSEYQQFILHPV